MGSIAGRGFDSRHLHQSFKFMSSCICVGVFSGCGIYLLGGGLIGPDARGRLLQNSLGVRLELRFVQRLSLI